MIAASQNTGATRTGRDRCGEFIIEDPATWLETMETARNVRSDMEMRRSYLEKVTADGRGDYAPLYFLLQQSSAGELGKEISAIIGAERLSELSPADTLNRGHVSARIFESLCKAMLKASGDALRHPCFVPKDCSPNINKYAGIYYAADYIIVTEIAEAASIITTAGYVVEVVIVLVAEGVPPLKPGHQTISSVSPTSSEVLRAVVHPGECRAIAEFLAPYLSSHDELARRGAAGACGDDGSRMPVGSDTAAGIEHAQLQ